MEAKQHIPILVQMYDKEVIREYRKVFKGFVFSSEEVVRTETIKNSLFLEINSERMPDEIYLNGILVNLVKAQSVEEKSKNVLKDVSWKELQNLKLKEGHAVEFIKE